MDPAYAPLAVVGAGIHGVTIALHLLDAGRCRPDEMRLLDPAGRPLAQWLQSTSRMGMRELRSHWLHHVAPDPWALVDYARRRGVEPLGTAHPTPPLPLFNQFCAAAATALEPVTQAAAVKRIEPLGAEGYRLALDGGGSLLARRVIYAPGLFGRERWPAPAARLRGSGRVLLAREVDVRDRAWDGKRMLVIGAGLTGATLALRLQEAGARVTLIHRTQIRQRRYDVDDSWMKNEHKLKQFARMRDMEERRTAIRGARRGSVTPWTFSALRQRDAEGRLAAWVHTELLDLRPAPGGCFSATLGAVGSEAPERLGGRGQRHGTNREMPVNGAPWEISADSVVNATGFDLDVTSDPCLADVLAQPGVACLDGRPLLSPALELLPGLHLSGWAAELQIGPVARNIVGARMAARLIGQLPLRYLLMNAI